jgi:hypothetical protein
MNRKSYFLTLKNPCNKKWSTIHRTDNERFCSSCSKTVLDFTKLTDYQIVDILKGSEEKICARLSEQQLERELRISSLRKYNFLIPKFLSGLILFSSVENVNANIKKEKIEINCTKNYQEFKLEAHELSHKDSLNKIIKGKVLEFETNLNMASVSVAIKGSNIRTETDENGNFRLNVPDVFISKNIVLIITYLGYYSIVFPSKSKDLLSKDNIFIIKPSIMVMGEIDLRKKSKWWQFWRQ